MRAPTILGVLLCSLSMMAPLGAPAGGEHAFRSLFNGRDLTDWEGDPELWSVVDGAITGVTKEESPLPYNKFLIWTGARLRNFELRLKLRLTGNNNSGIQYRSRHLPEAGEYVVGGYQADIHPRPSYNGMLYEERGRGIIAQHGQKVIIDAKGDKWEVGTTGPILQVELSEWNEYTILAQGNRLIHKVNDHTTVDIVDHQIPERSLEGILAFQVHRGPQMQVQIKDVRLKVLPSGGVLKPDQTPIPADAKKIVGRRNVPHRQVAGQTGSWGDQGDGTFRNPILNGDYPDVDIEQQGDRYYLITSTNHYAPGMTLAESKDLVNWHLIGHVWEKLSWDPKYNWDQMTGYRFGVWAGDLAFHKNRWYCYFIDFTSGLYVSTAEQIAGPWSEPICMLEKTNWTDPAVYWDEEDQQAYLVCNFGRDPALTDQRANQIRLFRMSWDGLRLLDEGQAIYSAPGAEAAKIYKIDGLYYIFLAEWRNNDRKQIVLRGKSLYGTLERRVLMERASETHRSSCQGALVKAGDGSWWFSHQLVQRRERTQSDIAGAQTGESFEGRPQWLLPVRWADGWPVLGEDPDGNGIGNTVLYSSKPKDQHALTAPQTDDEFNQTDLSPQWQWNHNPRDGFWSLTARPGYLRLRASVPVGEGGFWNAANTLSQRLMGRGFGEATTKVDLAGMKPGQKAGFSHHSGQYVLLGVKVAEDGTKRLFFNNNGMQTEGPRITEKTIYYRTRVDSGWATMSYSIDGESWNRIGEEFRLIFGNWRGDRLGFFCWNDESEAGYIDIDWFRYDYDGPKASGDMKKVARPEDGSLVD